MSKPTLRTIEVPQALKVRVIASDEEFKALEDKWNSLLGQSPDKNIFLTWEWMYTWWQYFGQNKRLRLVVVENGDHLTGVLPLMLWGYNFGVHRIEILENIGSASVDYGGAIFAHKDEIISTVVLSWLKEQVEQGKIVILNRIPEESCFLQLLQAYVKSSPAMQLYKQPDDVCVYVSLGEGFDGYSRSLSKHFRKNIRRRFKELSQTYKLDFVAHVGTNVTEDMHAFLELYLKRWQSHKSRMLGHFSHDKGVRFSFDLLKAMDARGRLWMTFLLLNQKVSSCVLGFEYGDKWWRWKSAFDPDFGHFGLGQIHAMHLLEEAASRRVKEVDLLRGNQPHKLVWSNGSRRLVRVILTKPGLMAKARLNLATSLIRLTNKVDIEKRSIFGRYNKIDFDQE